MYFQLLALGTVFRGVWCASIVGLTMLWVIEPARALTVQEVIDRAKPSVAHISVLGSSGAERSSGSGFVVSNDGKLMTNYHVVSNADHAVAIFDGGAEVEVLGVVAFDADADLAVLQLGPVNRAPLQFSEESATQGQEVVVIGSPRGFRGTASTGIVSAVRAEGVRSSEAIEDNRPSWQLQLTAPISPGSSGSPILSEDGKVIGVAVGVYRGDALHFGIPARFATQLLQRSGELQPISVLRTGRSVATNLLISAVGVGSVLLVAWLVSWWVRKRERKGKKPRTAFN